MPNISWNDIKHNALLFSRRWETVTSEQAEKQTFWNEFFAIFGITRRLVATFESPVKRRTGSTGFIDLLWKGKLLVEHKSAGESLDAAQSQAFAYILNLHETGRDDEIPRYVVLSDFRRFALYDLEPEEQPSLPLFANLRYHREEFPLSDLRHHVGLFAFIPNYTTHKLTPQDPANLKAVELMANLHDTLKRGGYTGHDLERFLVRVLFCLFAEDTGIFEPDEFQLYIENRTQGDGSDLGARLAQLFHTLNKPPEDRQRSLDETLANFKYVNGQLFSENIGFADFDRPMREALLRCCRFDWSKISPAIFGALFQNVIDQDDNPGRRRNLGAHYTSERDILKLIKPLFLDGLRAELNAAIADRSGRRSARLDSLRLKLTTLRFFDPACGCGNFLVIAYRELRLLELDILTQQHGAQQALTLDQVANLSQLDVNQFYGIEIEEWPARIAEVALWLMDHQSNMRIHEAFSQPFLRLPLRNAPHIHVANALQKDWTEVLAPAECSYILGNPPFVGAMMMSEQQHNEVKLIAPSVRNAGILDYVCAWYIKAAAYIAESRTVVAFVSTNSLSQGEQVGILWHYLFLAYAVQIVFAYTTFTWESEARGKAHVHVVIIGFAVDGVEKKLLFESQNDKTAFARQVSNISPYLVEGPNITVINRSSPSSDAPSMKFGSMPRDGGYLILSQAEYDGFVSDEPDSRKFVRRYTGADDFLNGGHRYCLWLHQAEPSELRKSPFVVERLRGVRQFRQSSKAASTRKAADSPGIFVQLAQPRKPYLLVPRVSSERRKYIPMAFMGADVIANDQVLTIEAATTYHFAVLTSAMHMAWVKRVAGRLKSDFRYSKDIVYNNFPWPTDPTDTQRSRIETLAQAVLDARAAHPTSTLADLYDPLYMPADLLKPHQTLDRAVDRLYRPEPFPDDQARVEHLFKLYEQLTAPLLPATTKIGRRKTRTS